MSRRKRTDAQYGRGHTLFLRELERRGEVDAYRRLCRLVSPTDARRAIKRAWNRGESANVLAPPRRFASADDHAKMVHVWRRTQCIASAAKATGFCPDTVRKTLIKLGIYRLRAVHRDGRPQAHDEGLAELLAGRRFDER